MSTPFEEIRVDELVPEQLRGTAENLISFLKVYYAQTDNNPSSFINFISKNRDVDQIASETFLNALGQTVAKGVPDSSVVEKSFLLKRLVDYYNLKGTNKSIIIFFQLFYDTLVEVVYPWDYVLETSSARYEPNKLIRMLPADGVDPFTLVGKKIEQKNNVGLSIAEAEVTRVTVEQYDELIYVLHFEDNSISGDFSAGDIIYYNNVSYGTTYLSLSEITPITGAKGFATGDILFLDYQPLSTFVARVATVGRKGEILKFEIIERGSGNGNGLENFKREGSNLPLRIRRAKEGDVVEPTNLGTDPEDNLSILLKFSVMVNNAGVVGANKNLLSSNIVLQDGLYYDKFTYQVNTNITYSNYEKAYNDLIHPAGYNLHSNLEIETTPPIEFKERNSYVNVDELLSLVFQPGGSETPRGRTYSLYGSSPASTDNTPDEVVDASPYSTIGRESYSFSQSPTDIETLKIIHDSNYSTPKVNYFLEDFVDSGVTLRNIEVSGAAGTYTAFRRNGLYKPGVDLSPALVQYLSDYENTLNLQNVTSPGPLFTHGGKINGLHYWYNTDSTPGFEVLIFNVYSAFKTDAIRWTWLARPKQTDPSIPLVYTATKADGIGYEIPPTNKNLWSGTGTLLDNATIKYGNVTENDKFRTQFR